MEFCKKNLRNVSATTLDLVFYEEFSLCQPAIDSAWKKFVLDDENDGFVDWEGKDDQMMNNVVIFLIYIVFLFIHVFDNVL